MARRMPKCLEGIDFLPNIAVTIILEGGIVVIGRLIAEIEERHHDQEHFPTQVNLDVDLEPEFLLVQLTATLTIATVTLPIGTVVAINLNEVLLIGPGTTP